MLLHQSNGTLTDFRGKLVVLAHGSIFSKVGASSKPGVIQPSFRTPKETRAGKGTCNLLAPLPRGGSTPVSPLTVRPLGGVADACFVCESRGCWNLPNGPFPFGAHRDRAQAMLREYVRFNATKRERTRRNAMMCEDVRLIVDSRVDRERSHKFAVSFDGKICVVGLRASAKSSNTPPYSPLARRHPALRGAPSLPRQLTALAPTGGTCDARR